MTIPLDALTRLLNPQQTVLLFGAGASIPSGAPSVSDIVSDLSKVLKEPSAGYSFAEYCSLFQIQRNRQELVSIVRQRLKNLRPTGGLQNLPNSQWRSIFTTNYDDLIEKCYLKRGKSVKVFSSNFDFDGRTPPDAVPIFKLHGTVGLDVADGHNSRMVLTTEDNDLVEEYRQKLYDRLKGDLADSNLVIIGHSLADPDIRSITQRALKLKKEAGSPQNVYLLIYTKDENRALLAENQGLRVAFGSVDDFFLELERNSPSTSVEVTQEDVLGKYSSLTPTTFDISHEASKPSRNFDAMYAGAASQYPEIRAGLTFDRTARHILKQDLSSGKNFLTILGASGVGKTTLARQIALSLVDDGLLGWEHHQNRPLLADQWRLLASDLREQGKAGVLFIDDAHTVLPELNSLVDLLIADQNSSLKIIVTSSNNHWKPRVKTANLSKFGRIEKLARLDPTEISNLLNLVQVQPKISQLVDRSFRGFTLQERKRRLTERCNRDFFVCMKNIFANDNFDIIVLREFSAISQDFQTIYKYICALESLGVVVHRQLVIRLLNVPVQDLSMILDHLDGLVEEYTIDQRNSIYGWRGRHPVISNIIMDYKFTDPDDVLSLLRRVVVSLSPSYDVEISTIRQLCSSDTGIRRVTNIDDQNELLRMMISTAPSERVPRHRLIANLIRQGAFSDAETEIRVFENDLKVDGPVRRYKIRLVLERAISTPGLMLEDKAKLLNDAHDAAMAMLLRYPNQPHSLRLFGDVCLETYKATGDYSYIDSVRDAMRRAEAETSDPEVTQSLIAFEHRLTRSTDVTGELAVLELDELDATVDTE